MSEHLGFARRLWFLGIMVYLFAAPIASHAEQAPVAGEPPADPAAAEEAREHAAWNDFSPSSRKTPAAAPRLTASTDITSSAALSTPSSSHTRTASPKIPRMAPAG